MKKIKKLTIRINSGYSPYDNVYEDVMVITENSLSYASKLLSETPVCASAKWKYRSQSKAFQDWFVDVCRV